MTTPGNHPLFEANGCLRKASNRLRLDFYGHTIWAARIRDQNQDLLNLPDDLKENS